jgi:hypothetical protein
MEQPTNKFQVTSYGYMVVGYEFELKRDLNGPVEEEMDAIWQRWVRDTTTWSLSLFIVFSNRNLEDSMWAGPSRDTRNKRASYGMHLPSEKILASPNRERAYLHYVFKAFADMLWEKFKVPRQASEEAEERLARLCPDKPAPPGP